MNLNITNSIPWFKSRKFLCLKIFLDSLLFLFFLNSNLYYQNISISKFIYVFFLIIIWIVTSYIFGRYEIDKSILTRNIFNQIYKSLITLFILFTINEFLKIILESPKLPYINFDEFLFLTFISFIMQLILNRISRQKLSRTENWIFINSSKNSKEILELLNLTRIKINISFIEFTKLKKIILKNVDGIVIDRFKENFEETSSFFYKLKQKNIKVLSISEWAGINLQRYPTELINENSSVIEEILLKKDINNFQMRIKRISEFFISLIILFFGMPLIIISSILIKLEDGGPIFYSQERTGYKGKKFKIYKLRTMRINSEINGPKWSTRNDPRITKIGSFLRKSRIDELPQLLLVIDGKLSLIGPRPERPDFDDILRKKIKHYDLRYFMKPGISGWAQVNYPYGASHKDAKNKLSYDLYYIRNFSNLLDFLILFKTIKIILHRQGAIPSN